MKGITGKVIAIVISLIIAVIALAILFGLLTKMKPMIISFLDMMVQGLIDKICSILGPVCWFRSIHLG